MSESERVMSQLRQGLEKAYQEYREAAEAHLKAAQEATRTKQVYEDGKYLGYAQGTIIGRNPEEREGNARLLLKAELTAWRMAERQEEQAKSLLDAKASMVEELRAMLRTYEVQAGYEARVTHVSGFIGY